MDSKDFRLNSFLISWQCSTWGIPCSLSHCVLSLTSCVESRIFSLPRVVYVCFSKTLSLPFWNDGSTSWSAAGELRPSGGPVTLSGSSNSSQIFSKAVIMSSRGDCIAGVVLAGRRRLVLKIAGLKSDVACLWHVTPLFPPPVNGANLEVVSVWHSVAVASSPLLLSSLFSSSLPSVLRRSGTTGKGAFSRLTLLCLGARGGGICRALPCLKISPSLHRLDGKGECWAPGDVDFWDSGLLKS